MEEIFDNCSVERGCNKQGIEREGEQLYKRPQVTGEARDKDYDIYTNLHTECDVFILTDHKLP